MATPRHARQFPDDIFTAAAGPGPISFSTILPTDSALNAEGRVGLIVDISQNSVVHGVGHEDIGSSKYGSLGQPPTQESCVDSIDSRFRSNEWQVSGYISVGILIIEPIVVPSVATFAGSEIPTEENVTLHQVLNAFPEFRVFKIGGSGFLQFNRGTNEWNPVAYDDIIYPHRHRTLTVLRRGLCGLFFR
jgi:hypothetical protein